MMGRMKRLSEDVKVDVGLVAQTLNNTNVTGRYFHLAKYPRLLAVLSIAAMAATKTAILELLQATDRDGTGSKGIPTTVGQTAIATVTANTLVTEATVVVGTISGSSGDELVINGITFTAADATSAAAREFADAAGLVTCVNNATYGVTGIIASANGSTVTLKSTDAGEYAITVSETGDNLTLATTKALAYVELDASELDLANAFAYVAPKVTTTANTVVSVEILRYGSRWMPTQKCGASAVV